MAFDKLNACLQDVQEWMLSSMLNRVHHFWISCSALDSDLPVRVVGNFMHRTVVKNLCVWHDANFSVADHVHNINKTCFIQSMILGELH